MKILGAAIALGLSLLFVTASCKDKEGDECSIGKHTCGDSKTMLACNTGRYVAAACKGPNGCVNAGSAVGVVCDYSLDEAGDRCAENPADKGVCSGDGKSMLRCRNSKITSEPCRGQTGCVSTEGGPVCDHDRAKEGDYCAPDQEENHACELRGNRMLWCKGGQYVEKSACKYCEVEAHKILCHN